jgi:hypothetical protein
MVHYSVNNSIPLAPILSQIKQVHTTLSYYSKIKFTLVTDFIDALPGNSSVDMVQHTTIIEAVISVVLATPSAGNGPVNSQSDT